MPKRIPEEELQAIEEAARPHPEGVTAQHIAGVPNTAVPLRPLQYRLKYLADNQRLVKEGEGRWTKYRLPPVQACAELTGEGRIEAQAEALVPRSKSAKQVQSYVRRPITARKPVGYDRAFLDFYRPHVSSYLSPAERAHLRQVGTSAAADQPAMLNQ